MLPALVELKRYILEQSADGWNSVEHARTVTRTLESILKVAEVRLVATSPKRGRGNETEDERSFQSSSGIGVGGGRGTFSSSLFESEMGEEEGDDDEDEDFFMEEEEKKEFKKRRNDEQLITFKTTSLNESTEMTTEGYEADNENEKIHNRMCPTDDEDEDDQEFEEEERRSLNYLDNQLATGIISEIHPLHDGVCQLIMEVLFELSKKCVADPWLWTNNLNTILNHLAVVSQSLGGTEWILKGFSLVLQTNDPRLRELQKSILNLVENIVTPGSLTAFMRLVTAENPPVELLLPKFYEITVKSMETEPVCELEFPIRDQSTQQPQVLCDQSLAKGIFSIRDYHKGFKLESPFTRSALICPINVAKFKPWTNPGFTVTTWMKWKGGGEGGAAVEPGRQRTVNDRDKLHVWSVGSNKVLLSIFLDADGRQWVEVTRPNATLSKDILMRRRNGTTGGGGIGGQPKKSSSVTNLFMKTMRVEYPDYYITKSPVQLGRRMKSSAWQHLAWSVAMFPGQIVVVLTVDGGEQHTVQVECENGIQAAKSASYSVFGVGETNSAALWAVGSYSMSNVMLFKKSIPEVHVLAELISYGPDFTCVGGRCQIEQLVANRRLVKDVKEAVTEESQACPTVEELDGRQVVEENLLMTFSAKNANLVLDASGTPMGFILCGGKLTARRIKSFATNLIVSGGLDVLLYLFARVVELTGGGGGENRSEMQALALKILLEAAHRNVNLYADFKRRHVSAVSSVLRTNRCDKSLHMLKVILDVAFDKEVLEVVDNGRSYKIKERPKKEDEECRLIYPELIIQTIKNFDAWIDEKGEENVIEVLLEVLLWLNVSSVQGGNYSKRQLLQVNLVDALLSFCKIHVGGISSRIRLTRTMAEKLVELLGIYGPTPPGAFYLDELAKLLLLIHEPSCVFISQDRVNYYYLLAACPPDKSKLRLGRTAERWTRGLRMIQRKRRGGGGGGVEMLQRSRNVSQEALWKPRNSTCGEIGEAVQNGQQLEKVERKRRIRRSEENVKEEVKDLVTMNAGDKLAGERKKIRCRDLVKLNRVIHNRKVAKRRRTIERRTPLYNRLGAHARKKETKNPVEDVWTLNMRRLNAITGGSSDELDNSCGASTLQKELLRLLQTYVILLPDNMVADVLDHYVNVELLLILANNENGGVRAQLLRLLSAMCDRMAVGKFEQLLEGHKFVHLANQLVIYPVTLDMVMACRRWVTLGRESITDELQLQKRNVGLIYLVALLPALVARHESSLVGVLQLLSELYEDCARTRTFIMQRTLLIPSLVKCWLKMFAKRPFLSLYERPGSHLLMFSYQICKSLFLTVGGTGGASGGGMESSVSSADGQLVELIAAPTIWDFLNGLDYVGTTSLAVPVRRGMRVIQAKILNGLLRQCLRRGGEGAMETGHEKYLMGMRKFHAMSIFFIRNATAAGGGGGSGSAAEMKMRFHQLMEKSIHFVQCKDSQYEPLQSEEELVKVIIRLGLATKLKIGSVIAWAMSPFRSIELRLFVVQCLTHLMRSKHVKTYGLNISIIRIFTKKFFGEVKAIREKEPQLVSEKNMKLVGEFARFLNTDTSVDFWALLTAMSKIDEISCKINDDNADGIERSVHKYEAIAADCMEMSIGLTRRFVEAQNTERRDLINQLRAVKRHIYQWKSLVSRMTHENAPFFNQRYFPNSWEMDETEGPSRVRLRMKRGPLAVKRTFLMPEFQELHKGVTEQRPLEYLLEANVNSRSSITDQVLYNFPATKIRGDSEVNGDLVITETVITFFPDKQQKEGRKERGKKKEQKWQEEEPTVIEVTNVIDIWLRRYQHKEKCVELFLNSGHTVLFMLQDIRDRRTFEKYFGDKVFDPAAAGKWHMFVMQQWREGQLTNWEYLTALNQLGGRSFQDLNTYPVFPWILADYESSVLDLTKREVFRNLERPIAVQHDDSLAYYEEKCYQHLKRSQVGTNSFYGNMSHFPYHFPCHYSNSGTVLSFLIRVPPYTQMFVRYQDNHFDLPDRTFFSLQHAWRLSSKESTTDVKELLPEFYTLPEMFENNEGFDFGVCQGGERVNHVNLPAWSNHSARLFTLIHRQALESDLVRENLRHWIDLIFGYKQTGEEAIKATNVFHSATYPDYAHPPSEDELFKDAYQTIVKTYGQMPKQLLVQPHPESLVRVIKGAEQQQQKEDERGGESPDNDVYQLPHCCSVKGLKWGKYTGSPELPPPVPVQRLRVDANSRRLICLDATNTVYAVPEHVNYMQGLEMDTINAVTWRNVDEVVKVQRVASGSEGGGIDENLTASGNLFVANGQLDEITCCGTLVNSGQLWLGYASGRIVVYAQQSSGSGGSSGECHPAAEKLNKMRYLQNSYLANTMSYNSAFRMFKSTGTQVNSMRKGSSWTFQQPTEKERGQKREKRRGGGREGSDFGRMNWGEEVTLIFHTDQVVDIRLSAEFKIAVSVGRDGRAAIWDTNKLEYVRQIEPPSTTSLITAIPIALLAISQTMGDIVTVHRGRDQEEEEQQEMFGDDEDEGEDNGDRMMERTGTTTDEESYEVTENNIDDFVRVSTTGFAGGRKTLMRLHTINAKYVNHVTVPERILSVCVSHVKEGIGINVVATGFESGLVKLWSSWDLSFVRQIDTLMGDVMDLGFTTYQHLVVLTKDGFIEVWEAKGLLGNAPKFPQIDCRKG